jgi:aryl-alcohol dehydrogenase-like predicted oxidoreductase
MGEPILVLGTAQFSRGYGAVEHDDPHGNDPKAFFRHAARVGFGGIDTAPSYGDAEDCIGASEVAVPVHTKIDRGRAPRDSVAASLRRLGRERVEILYFHDSAIALDDPADLISHASALVGETVGVLGASVYEPAELNGALAERRFGAVQVPLNVLDRRIGGHDLERAHARGCSVFVRSVFLQGLLLTDACEVPQRLAPLAPYVERVQSVIRETGRSVASVCLAWARDLPGVSGVVVGAVTTRELDALMRAWSEPPLDAALRHEFAALPTPPEPWCDPRSWPA